jgi:hypothetical protein
VALSARKTLLLKQAIAVQTRCANDVENEFNPSKPQPRDFEVCKKLIADFPKALPRTVEPSYGYNCHGMTFASRRTQVWSSTEIQHILKEDGYVEVNISKALPGDVAIYQSPETGEIDHSGIVVEQKKDLSGPWVVSKWGPSQEFVHPYMHCPYAPASVKFYRMHK